MYQVNFYGYGDTIGKACIDDAGEVIRFATLVTAERYAHELNIEFAKPGRTRYAAAALENCGD